MRGRDRVGGRLAVARQVEERDAAQVDGRGRRNFGLLTAQAPTVIGFFGFLVGAYSLASDVENAREANETDVPPAGPERG